jgi:hypothetical protein
MTDSLECLEQRRRTLARRRRLIFTAGLVLLLAAVAVTLLLGRSHRVVVVRVVPKAHDAPSGATTSTQAEYPAAPGAPSLQSVRAALAAAEHAHAAGARPSSGSTDPLLTGAATSSFQQFASSLPGHVELAVMPLGAGRREVLGVDGAAHGWSTTKVPVLVALLRARGAAGLTAQERGWAASAITESSNESVLSLFDDLERLEGGLGGASAYMESLLRMSGDNETVIATTPPPPGAVTTFGQTQWRPGEAVKFFRALALGCLLPASQTSYVLGLMQSIESSESWGLGSAGFSSVAFKGGWGPESGAYLVRQSGIIDPGSSSGAAVAIVALAPSFAVGTEMLTRTAAWLDHQIRLSPRPRAGCISE